MGQLGPWSRSTARAARAAVPVAGVAGAEGKLREKSRGSRRWFQKNVVIYDGIELSKMVIQLVIYDGIELWDHMGLRRGIVVLPRLFTAE